MVFRNINRYIARKKTLIQKKEDKQIRLEKYFKEFLVKEYGSPIFDKVHYTLFYEPKEDRLIIETGSKILANDLVLKLSKIAEFFSNNSCNIGQIVIK